MAGFSDSEIALLQPGENPWPYGWEQDERVWRCFHEWQMCYRPAIRVDAKGEHFARCRLCLAPRCGDSNLVDPCMKRRHHRGEHAHLGADWGKVLADPPPVRDADALERWLVQ